LDGGRPHGKRVWLVGLVVAVVLLVALAVILGGSGTPHRQASLSTAGNSGSVAGLTEGTTPSVPVPAPTAARALAPLALGDSASGSAGSASSTASTASGSTTTTSGASTDSSSSAASDVAATRIVKTGTVELTVPKGKVASTVSRLATLATDDGGYVASSQTDSGTDPSGEITLRIPVAKFGAVVSSVGTLGKITHQSTHADDVTGKYVDLSAQEHALQQTRSTYLTILSHATTIGATLAVQQRVDDVQRQIDELHGQLKVLGNQSAYSTLTADVSERGSTVVVAHHHPRTGLAKAWTTSWHRFNRGIDAMVAAIGPLVLALIILAVLALLVRLAFRATVRTSRP
jgi:hypothetical protein